MSEREVFHLMAWSWDVDKARELAADLPVVHAPVAALSRLLAFIRVDTEYARGRDLSEPLLAVVVPELGTIVIDGWHRIYKAQNEHVKELPIRVLGEDEERQVRISGN